MFCYEGDDVAGLIRAAVDYYRSKLADGGCVKLEIEVEFEPVKYEKFINSINLPPYSPFIVDAKIKK